MPISRSDLPSTAPPSIWCPVRGSRLLRDQRMRALTRFGNGTEARYVDENVLPPSRFPNHFHQPVGMFRDAVRTREAVGSSWAWRLLPVLVILRCRTSDRR